MNEGVEKNFYCEVQNFFGLRKMTRRKEDEKNCKLLLCDNLLVALYECQLCRRMA
jgi:hypothetical protein